MASPLCMSPAAIPLMFPLPPTAPTKNKRKAELEEKKRGCSSSSVAAGIILLQQQQQQQPQRRTSARLSSSSTSASSSSSSAPVVHKRPRLSAAPTTCPAPAPAPTELTPPPTPVLSHKTLPLRTPSPPPQPPSRRVPSLSITTTLPRTSRYQHFTSPLCPRPHSPMTVPHLNPKCRRLIPRASSPPHHSGRWNGSLLHWTLQKNHCLAVRQRQYLSATSSSSSSYTPLQIYPYAPSSSSSLSTSGESDSDSSDDEDGEWGDGWDEGECEIMTDDDTSSMTSSSSQESNWRIVVPSQHHRQHYQSTSMRIPRACTPPNSPEKMEDVEEEVAGEPVIIKEGVTTIVLT